MSSHKGKTRLVSVLLFALVIVVVLSACGATPTPTPPPTATKPPQPTATAVPKPAAPTAVPTAVPTVAPTATKPPAPTATPVPAKPQIYREGFPAGCTDLSTLNTGCAHRLDTYVNEPLVAITWKGGLQPMLAESYEMQQGGKVWIFKLRKNVKWHDGTPFTAKDVVFSFNIYADPKVNSRRNIWLNAILGFKDFRDGKTASLQGVTAVDDYTVRVELAEAAPLWIRLRGTYIVMLPEHILSKVAKEKLLTDSFWYNRVGTGPFKMTKFAADQYIELTRNDDYYLGKPKLEKIILRMYADAATQVAALERGEIDTTAYETTIISVTDIKRLDALPNIDVLAMDKGAPLFIRVNHKDPQFKDVRVRQAFRYAIDVEKIMQTVYLGARPAYTMFPQEWTWPADLNKYTYNPTKAKELLKEAGWPSNRKVDFIYTFSDQMSKDLVVAIQQYLAEVGVTVVPRLVDSAAGTEAVNSGKLEMGLYGFGMGLDPSIGDGNCLCGAALAVGYCNPEVDKLFAEGAKLLRQEDRAPIYQKISKILNEEMQSIWLAYDVRPMGFNRQVVGPYEHYSEQKIIYFNMPVYNEVEKWYVK